MTNDPLFCEREAGKESFTDLPKSNTYPATSPLWPGQARLPCGVRCSVVPALGGVLGVSGSRVAVIEMIEFYAVQYGSHHSHGTIGHLQCD